MLRKPETPNPKLRPREQLHHQTQTTGRAAAAAVFQILHQRLEEDCLGAKRIDYSINQNFDREKWGNKKKGRGQKVWKRGTVLRRLEKEKNNLYN